MSPQYFLDMAGEDQHCQIVRDETMLQSVLDESGIVNSEAKKNPETAVPAEILSTRTQLLKALSIVKRGALNQNVLCANVDRFFSAFQSNLRSEQMRRQRQSTLDGFTSLAVM